MDGNTFWNSGMGELTEIAAGALFDFDERNEFDRNEFMRTPENFVGFPQGLMAMLSRKYSDVDEECLSVFIKKCIESSNVNLSLANVKNWLSGKVNPQANAGSRDDMYKLCFALKFSAEETTEFFSKVYLSRPFDCREVREAIYLFCLNNGLSYKRAEELLKEVNEKCISNETEDSIPETRILNMKISNIHNDRDLISFVMSNRASFVKWNSTALRTYNRLLEEAKELTGAGSGEALLELIYDMKLSELKGDLSIKKKSSFLKVVNANFPQKQQLHQIKKEQAQYDTIRKALILMKFYVFFLNVGNNNSEEDFNDFWKETNDMLSNCGYALLYPRNPYDWIFLHCAACSHDRNLDILLYQPLDEFRIIMVDMICFE